jgi:hypothetical protein
MALDFDHLLGLHTGERRDHLIIGRIDWEVALCIGASTNLVFLSHRTIQKQIHHHKELTIAQYRFAGPCVAFGEYRQDTETSAVILFLDTKLTGRYFRGYLRSSAEGREVYLASFVPIRARSYRAELRKPYKVIRPHDSI